MSKRQFAKCRPKREHGKGWGLVAIDGVNQGDLVQEYAGEIIDEKTKEERLQAWSRDHPHDPNFYVMHLEPGWYVVIISLLSDALMRLNNKHRN